MDDDDETNTKTAAEQDALEKLQDAHFVSESTDDAVKDVFVKTYLKTGGLPSRIVQAPEGSTGIPDLSTSASGREMLDALDRRIAAQIAALQSRRRRTA
jgi:hypothetical protein